MGGSLCWATPDNIMHPRSSKARESLHLHPLILTWQETTSKTAPGVCGVTTPQSQVPTSGALRSQGSSGEASMPLITFRPGAGKARPYVSTFIQRPQVTTTVTKARSRRAHSAQPFSPFGAPVCPLAAPNSANSRSPRRR